MRQKNALWTVLLLVVIAGLAYWLWEGRADRAPLHRQPVPTVTAPAVESGPRYPLPEIPASQKPELRPLPSLDDSDEYLRLDVASVFGEPLANLLVDAALIERLVATIDNLPRAQIAERIRPAKSLATPFVALGQDDSGEYLLGQDNYQRYDALVAQLQAVDADRIVEMYRRYYPLFQKAYEGLGYPERYFNDRLVEVLEHLLATPDPGTTVTLVQPHVLFEYADENLAALSSGQKLLVRMGPDNRQAVLDLLREIRNRVAFTE